MGIGDHCRCHLQADASSHKKIKQDQQCRRCLKPKATTSQSMTGWLFKREFCKCEEVQPQTKHNLNFAVPAFETTNRSGISRKVLLAATVVALVSTCGFFGIQFARETISAIEPLRSKVAPIASRQILAGFAGEQNSEYLNLDIGSRSRIEQMQYSHLQLKDSNIRDVELIDIVAPTCVSDVSLNHCQGFSATGLCFLAQRDHIKTLSLEHTALNRKMLDSFVGSTISKLNLEGTRIDDLDWSFLSKMPCLLTINLKYVRVSAQNAALLERLHFKGEHGVYLRYTASGNISSALDFNPDRISEFALKSNSSGTQSDDKRYLQVGYFGNEEPKTIEFTRYTWSVIGGSHYSYALFRGMKISDNELIELSNNDCLQAIALNNCHGFTFVGVGYLARSKATVISLKHTALDQAMLDRFASSKIVNLDLTDTKIGDKNWSFLTKMTELERVYLGENKVTSANAKILEQASLVFTDGSYRRKRHREASKS